jgi:hypothetical protein
MKYDRVGGYDEFMNRFSNFPGSRGFPYPVMTGTWESPRPGLISS